MFFILPRHTGESSTGESSFSSFEICDIVTSRAEAVCSELNSRGEAVLWPYVHGGWKIFAEGAEVHGTDLNVQVNASAIAFITADDNDEAERVDSLTPKVKGILPFENDVGISLPHRFEPATQDGTAGEKIQVRCDIRGSG